jgi:hypothetical protein
MDLTNPKDLEKIDSSEEFVGEFGLRQLAK